MEYYISEANGDVNNGDGTKTNPFKNLDDLFAALNITKDQPINFKVFCEKESEYKEISKAQIKKTKTYYFNKKKSNPDKPKKQPTEVIGGCELKLDESLPSMKWNQFNNLKEVMNKRIIVQGWVQFIRKQSKKLWFVSLRNGTGHIQCVFEASLCNCKDSSQLFEECSIRVWGLVSETNSKPDYEIKADYFEIIGNSISGGIENVMNVESDVETKFDNRHLMIRGMNTSKILVVQDIVMKAFHKFYEEEEMKQTFPPTFVPNQCEGGGSLFTVDYFGEEAFLSQTSQLYLETAVPVLGKCYGVTRSYRAEKSRTRRHLSEFIHIEGELAFINFEDLLNHIEHLLVRVSELIMELGRDIILEVNPNYKPIKGPFKRMTYEEAITFLQKNNIQTFEGKQYEFGDDIPESAERKILDILNEVIMITKFPVEIKAFYMPKCEDDKRVTESVDVLVPGVGEIIGGSMRIWDLDELNNAYARNNLNPDLYYWYTDLRRYGSVPHGGYGLGFERFLTWVTAKEHIRDVCMYPRYVGRCNP